MDHERDRESHGQDHRLALPQAPGGAAGSATASARHGGERPLARTHHKYEWLVYVFVHPSTGRTFWLILSSVSTELISLALVEFARAFGINARHRVLLVIDQAGWHIAGELRVPEGIELVFLPPYTPEMQPAERLWPLLNEAVANNAIESLDALEQRLETRCVTLAGTPEAISALTDYHWWPQAA